MTPINNRSDLTFMLRDWFGIDELLERRRFSAHTFDTVEAMLDLAERLAPWRAGSTVVDAMRVEEFLGEII